MTQTRWWWVRHAPVTENNGTIYGNLDLNCDCHDKDSFQALGGILPDEAIWVTTPLKRTHQTADAIRAEMLARDFPAYDVIDDFQEQSFGDWHGMTHQELGEIRGDPWHRFWHAPASEAPPGGESFESLIVRTAKSIDALNQKYIGKDIIAVTHGGTIRAAVAHALDLNPEKALGLSIGNLSLTRLDYYLTEDENTTDHSSWGVGSINAEPFAFKTKKAPQ
ncbi:histidine phosphatase family protein [Kiloniella sp. EL199]|uniref:histidine phosphatase family protein n=1 Tax=Kiloniella sp. EL199 TaxID=2107581 RepID=UPI000EA30556|nr:histidine phosphatase family protein [Kiloniella sp. EL199]